MERSDRIGLFKTRTRARSLSSSPTSHRFPTDSLGDEGLPLGECSRAAKLIGLLIEKMAFL